MKYIIFILFAGVSFLIYSCEDDAEEIDNKVYESIENIRVVDEGYMYNVVWDRNTNCSAYLVLINDDPLFDAGVSLNYYPVSKSALFTGDKVTVEGYNNWAFDSLIARSSITY